MSMMMPQPPQDALADSGYGVKIKTFRREAHMFFLELDKFLKSIRAVNITAMSQSESLGWITLTIAYHEAPEVPAGA